jgi:hypothetical protein
VHLARDGGAQDRRDRLSVGLRAGRDPEGDGVEVAEPPRRPVLDRLAAERLEEGREVTLVARVVRVEPALDGVVAERLEECREGAQALAGGDGEVRPGRACLVHRRIIRRRT